MDGSIGEVEGRFQIMVSGLYKSLPGHIHGIFGTNDKLKTGIKDEFAISVHLLPQFCFGFDF